MSARSIAAGLLVLAVSGCGEDVQQPARPALESASAPAPAAAPTAPAPAAAVQAPALPAALPQGLLVALSVFEKGADDKPVPRSELLLLRRQDGAWQGRTHIDPESNVFHKALVLTPPGAKPGIVTLGGTAAVVKLWREGANGLEAETLWQADFGGKFSRMRDAEIAPILGGERPVLAVATHDQGVVALVSPEADGWAVRELDREPGKFVHEIEVGDLDADGALEIYATPSDPNKLDGQLQHGEVVRYVPLKNEGRTVVADLGDRHAKEILVEDVDGDGVDELYVSVEAAEGGDLSIRRFDAGTPPEAGILIATLHDPMCRFLTAGDLDGDGKLEVVAAAKDTGLWLLRPGTDPRAPWKVEPIDADSKGFEHAALLADLDGDGRDELYVASDSTREIRRYVEVEGRFPRETIYRHAGDLPLLTWNLATFPADLVK